ncbi:MAG: hypothetical protein JXB17_10010, partial [Bacteroidales bacterium]|nr:hypothetical protein [Bacteroidales bacterium]
MKKAVIFYLSKTGITRQFGEEIKNFLNQNQVSAELVSVYDYYGEDLSEMDYIFLGAWTHGLFVLFQHPDKPWVDFARQLPVINDKKVILFTTYTIAVGSMFRKMRKHLQGKNGNIVLELKSKNDSLSQQNKDLLTRIL